MSSSLSGLRVLVTRPDPQHRSICSAIAEHEGIAVHFPLIKIEALTADNELQEIKSKILNLDNYHLLIFVSSNAVHYGATYINDYWPQFPVGVEVIAVGPGTARKVSAELNCKAVYSESGANSEAILELAELKQVDNKRIAIFRGEGGRELLADTLSERGAVVDYIEVYKRRDADNTSAQLAKLIMEERLNVFSVSSGESLDRLNGLLQETSAGHKDIPVIVPSQRVAAQAEQLGFAAVKIANGADLAATINALQELAN